MEKLMKIAPYWLLGFPEVVPLDSIRGPFRPQDGYLDAKICDMFSFIGDFMEAKSTTTNRQQQGE